MKTSRTITRRLLSSTIAILFLVLAGRTAETHNPITTTVRFNKEIAPIIFAKCAPCHFEGGPAPMSLLTYDDARPWAQAIKEEVLERQMPPWPAKQGYGAFANDRSLTSREREFLVSWLDGGVPRGEGAIPEYVDHSAHWMLGTPDEIGQAVRDNTSQLAPGVRRFVVKTSFRRPQLVRAIDVKVDKKTTRAAFLWLVDTGQYLGGWMPGHGTIELPGDAVFRFPARARVAIDVIERPQGPSSATLPEIGIYARQKPGGAITKPLTIAATGATGERHVRARHPLTAPHSLIGFHVDTGGPAASVQLNARRPDGSIEPLLWMRDVTNRWPVPFVFREPVRLPAGTVLEISTDYSKDRAAAPTRAAVHLIAHETPPEPTDADTRLSRHTPYRYAIRQLLD